MKANSHVKYGFGFILTAFTLYVRISHYSFLTINGRNVHFSENKYCAVVCALTPDCISFDTSDQGCQLNTEINYVIVVAPASRVTRQPQRVRRGRWVPTG